MRRSHNRSQTLAQAFQRQRLWNWLLALVILGTGASTQLANAKTNPPDEFPPNPLELKGADPLLPTPNRPLTEAEQKQLASALDGLNAQAAKQLKTGDRLGAFETWDRELRLRRVLGLLQEIPALGRVGEIAWKENEQTQVHWITQRLDSVFQEAQKPNSGDPATRIAVLDALGQAYQRVRSSTASASAYQLVLADARQRKDGAKVEATLNTLAQLYLDWFDYPKSGEAYQELLKIAKARGDRANETLYLTQLAYLYEQAKQPEQAIPYQQELVALYQQSNNLQPIPALKIKIADNYQRLAQLAQAEQNYQSAYQLAQPLAQFGYASDALQKLGLLYRSNQRLDAALRVYEFLISVEQQAYNFYGMMNAYDQIGQIELERKAYPEALTAFQRGLALARQLKYAERETYFTTQLKQAAAGFKQ